MTEAKHEGPKLRIEASCYGCIHCKREYYACQSDTGYDVPCEHPSTPSRIGLGWATPEWCPLLPAAIEQLKANCLRPMIMVRFGR
jgi:hypothetical protein